MAPRNETSVCYLWLLAAVVLADGANICDHDSSVVVEVEVFSGMPNPTFDLQKHELDVVCRLLGSSAINSSAPTCSAFGFGGWTICPFSSGVQGLSRLAGAGTECLTIRGEPRSDDFLFAQLLARRPDLPQDVMEDIAKELKHGERGGNMNCTSDVPPSLLGPNNYCDQHPRGSDDPHEVHWDKKTDCAGCFDYYRAYNNCYNYAVQFVTNTMAQPGRASGLCPPRSASGPQCGKCTCGGLIKNAVADGLQWVGKRLPRSLPAKGHYVSLHVRGTSDYHFTRMNSDMTWSHKPGRTYPKNTDNSGRSITDPSMANLSPWNDFCGYLLATPSKSNIKMMAEGASSPEVLV